jgi:hypothetical protein
VRFYRSLSNAALRRAGLLKQPRTTTRRRATPLHRWRTPRVAERRRYIVGRPPPRIALRREDTPHSGVSSPECTSGTLVPRGSTSACMRLQTPRMRPA